MSKYTIEVIFKRSVADVARNLFRPKAKRFSRVATFKDVAWEDFDLGPSGSDAALSVTFGASTYTYPSHMIARIKVTRH